MEIPKNVGPLNAWFYIDDKNKIGSTWENMFEQYLFWDFILFNLKSYNDYEFMNECEDYMQWFFPNYP